MARKPKKPRLPKIHRKAAEAARDLHRGRLMPPGLAVEGDGRGGWHYASPWAGADDADWFALVFQALGTRSTSVATAFTHHLARLCPAEWQSEEGDWRPNQEQLDALFAIMGALVPANEAEAALAAQACALHLAAMKLGANIGSSNYPSDRTVAVLAKTVRAYGSAVETIARLQGRGIKRTTQTIEVHHHEHKHVHFERGGDENGGQPDATGASAGGISIPLLGAGVLADCPSVPGTHKGRRPMPSGRRSG